MVEYVEFGVGSSKAAIKLTDVTLVTGAGKSLFLNAVYKVTAGVGKRVPWLNGRWYLYLQNGDVAYSVQVNRGKVRQTLSVKGEEVVYEYIKAKSIHRLVKPIEVAVVDASVIIPEVKTQEHVSIVAEEDLDRLNKLVAVARRHVGIRSLYLGPFVNPRGLVDASASTFTTLDRHGGNLAGVLSYLSLYRPASFNSIRSALKKLGFSISVGLARPGKIGALLSTKTSKFSIAKAPCSVKSLLTILTALELNPQLLVVENLDYCLTRKTAEILSSFIKQKNVRMLAEIHNEEIVEWITTPSKTVAEVYLFV